MNVDLPADLHTRLDTWAAARGMTPAEAIRHLIATGMTIGDAARTMQTVGRNTIASMFPEAEDIDAAWSLIEAELQDSYGTLETHPDGPYCAILSTVLVRGKWLVSVERSEDGWKTTARTATVHDDEDAAREAWTVALVDLTGELWAEGDELPLWWCEGVDGDDIEWDRETRIPWRGLVPDGAVMDVDELAAQAAGTLDAYRQAQADEAAAAAAERRRPVDPAVLADRRCPHCGSTGMVVAGRPVLHSCKVAGRAVPESEMNPKHYA